MACVSEKGGGGSPEVGFVGYVYLSESASINIYLLSLYTFSTGVLEKRTPQSHGTKQCVHMESHMRDE